jgi:glutamate-1-semialdehyde 2,1-aminomutase
MDRIAPEGDIYQAGTLSGNPLAVAAGTVTLELLEADGVYEKLAKSSETLTTGLLKIAEEVGVPLSTRHVGGMFGFFFQEGPVNDFAQAQQSDAAAFKCFFGAMLDEGVYLAPSSYEAGFMSLAHGPRALAETLEAARKALTRVAQMR